MRRVVLGLVLFASIAPLQGAHATQVGNVSVAQNYNFYFSRYLPDGGFENIFFYAGNSVGGTLTGSTVTPTTDFKAQAGVLKCDASYVCTSVNYPLQQISPTGLSIDPLGNSIHFVACLTPASGPCGNFDFTAARPASIAQCLACTSLPNAWVDPTGNVVGGSLYVFSGISRFNYTLSGSFSGAPIATGFIGQDGFNEYLFGTVVATAP